MNEHEDVGYFEPEIIPAEALQQAEEEFEGVRIVETPAQTVEFYVLTGLCYLVLGLLLVPIVVVLCIVVYGIVVP